MDFIFLFGSIANDLSILLDLQFIPGNHYSRTFIGQKFQWILNLHNSKEYITRDAELLKIAFLTKHLKEIRSYDEKLFALFRKNLKKCMKAADFYGLRMEIYTAAALVRGNINFEKSESPDFQLRDLYKNTSIECGSAHFSQPGGHYERKIIGVLKTKASKPYAHPSAALFIDVTNILFSTIDSKIEDSTYDIKKTIRNELSINSFGSVILFSYIFLNEGNKIECNYIRTDNQNIDPTLLDFLNNHFPFGSYEPNDPWLTNQV